MRKTQPAAAPKPSARRPSASPGRAISASARYTPAASAGSANSSALPPCVNAVQQQTTAARIGMLSSVSRPSPKSETVRQPA